MNRKGEGRGREGRKLYNTQATPRASSVARCEFPEKSFETAGQVYRKVIES